jgi:hypothetical protein
MVPMGHAIPSAWIVRWQSGPGFAARGGGAMRDDVDDRLHDAVALDEINLFTEVLSAVAATDRRLTDDEIDAVLGLDRSAGAAPTA